MGKWGSWRKTTVKGLSKMTAEDFKKKKKTVSKAKGRHLTAAGRQVLRQSPDYQALLRSLGAQLPALPQR